MQRRSTVCVVQKLNVRSAAYFDILTVRISGRFFFCRKGGSLP
nr:MAG TPA: hypothetical protein [Caudoviricetes sp.]